MSRSPRVWKVNRKLKEDKDKEVESFNIWNIIAFNAELEYIHYGVIVVDLWECKCDCKTREVLPHIQHNKTKKCPKQRCKNST